MNNLGYYGMYLYYQTGMVVHNNVINLSTAVEAYTGIYCYYVKNNVQNYSEPNSKLRLSRGLSE